MSLVVIVGLDNRPVASIDDLHKILTHHQVGVRSPLTILRRQEKPIVEVVPEES